MSRIRKIDPESATGEVRELLRIVKNRMGLVPNLVRILANSPAALKAYLNFSAALQGGALEPQVRERIALAVAEANNCEYCLSAHSTFGRVAGLSEEEILNARNGLSADERISCILQFAVKIVEKCGKVTDRDLEEARKEGLTDEEIVASVAFNIYTTYFDHLVETEVDFPLAKPSRTRGGR